MPARLSPADDPIRPGPSYPLTITVDGVPVAGLAGQSVAGILLAAGHTSWRTTERGRRRGVFCGIGICHDCLLTVNGLPDVRACQRQATDGDVITTAAPAAAGAPDTAESGGSSAAAPDDAESSGSSDGAPDDAESSGSSAGAPATAESGESSSGAAGDER